MRNLVSLITAGWVLAISPVEAADDWSAPDICAAGVHSYFYLERAPKQIGQSDGWLVYRSKSGATYDCRVRENSLLLKWNSSNGPMSSDSTKFEVRGSTLTVRPKGLSPWRFRKSATGYALVAPD